MKPKSRIWLTIINVKSLLKVGKLENILDKTGEHNIKIIAYEESRYTNVCVFVSEAYRIFEGKPGEQVMLIVHNLELASW